MDDQSKLQQPETKLPEGILRFAGRKAGGGLAAVGNVLDLPGSTARDLLTWVPGGMEAQNPLDQWIDPLGYHADENRVYGREVLRANGMADQADTNGNFWGGLAYDVATDPLLYLTGGLTKAGEAIAKTGAMKLARPAANLKAAKMAQEATGSGAARLLRPIRGIGARAKITPGDILNSITDEAARAQAYDEFLKAGGTDAMLNEPLSAIKLKFPMSGYINQIQKKFTGKDLPEAFVRGVEVLKTNPSKAMERFVNNNLDRAKAGSAVDDTVPPPDGAGPVDPINPGDGPGPIGPVDPINQVDVPNGLASDTPIPTASNTIEQPPIHPATVAASPETWGNRAYDLMTDGADRVADLAYRVPLVSEASAMLRPELLGALTEQGREVGRLAYQETQDALANARYELFPLVKQIDESKLFDEPTLIASGLDKEKAIETINNRHRAVVDYLEGISTDLPPELAPIKQAADEVKQGYGNIADNEVADGIALQPLSDKYALYVKRQRSRPPQATIEFGSRGPIINTTHDSLNSRVLRDIPGGRGVIDDMSIDPNISGIGLTNLAKPTIETPSGLKSAREYVRDVYGSRLLSPEALKAYDPAKSADLDSIIGKINSLDPWHVESQTPLFGRDFLGDYATRLHDSIRARKMARATQDLLGKSLQPLNTAENLVPVETVLKSLPFNDGAINHILASADPVIAQKVQAEIANGINPIKALKGYGVDSRLVEEANRFIRPLTEPESIKPWLAAMAGLTSLFKSAVTVPFPAFHGRNYLGAQYQNFARGFFDPRYTGPKRWSEPTVDAWKLLEGKQIDTDGINFSKKLLTPEQKTEELAREVFAQGLIGKGQGIAGETLADTQGKLMDSIPGPHQPNPIKLRFSPKPEDATLLDQLDPLTAAGSYTYRDGKIKQVTQDTFAPYRIGRDVAGFTENIVRIGPYIALRRQGYAPKAAAELVKKAHTDYEALTPFEKRYARLVMPFYSWSRRQLPAQVEDLIKNPGGVSGTSIRLFNHLRDPSAPDYLGAAVPFGQDEKGNRTYISQFGLPWEDSLRLLNGPVRLDAGLTARELASRLNPVGLKPAVELATGKSTFFTEPNGEATSLADLDPLAGRLVQNISDLATGESTPHADPLLGSTSIEYALQNSPATRLLNTVKQVTDKRQLSQPHRLALNLLTGVRVGDLSVAQQDNIIRGRLQELLGELGGKQHVTQYLPPDVLEQLPQEKQEEVTQLNNALKVLWKRRKLRKKEVN